MEYLWVCLGFYALVLGIWIWCYHQDDRPSSKIASLDFGDAISDIKQRKAEENGNQERGAVTDREEMRMLVAKEVSAQLAAKEFSAKRHLNQDHKIEEATKTAEIPRLGKKNTLEIKAPGGQKGKSA